MRVWRFGKGRAVGLGRGEEEEEREDFLTGGFKKKVRLKRGGGGRGRRGLRRWARWDGI